MTVVPFILVIFGINNYSAKSKETTGLGDLCCAVADGSAHREVAAEDFVEGHVLRPRAGTSSRDAS